MTKNIFTVAPMLMRLLGSMAHNVEALAMWRYSVFRLPGAAAD